MKLEELEIPGVFLVHLRFAADQRGHFAKNYMKSFFDDHGLVSSFVESYHSSSQSNVIRGMHFQTPPDDHAKLVTPVMGAVLDVVLDIRRGSPTYGKAVSRKLSGDEPAAMYVPSGFAHGFAALEAPAILQYSVSSEHSPENDAGIAFDSFDFHWPIDRPILSERDRALPSLNKFDSPFSFP